MRPQADFPSENVLSMYRRYKILITRRTEVEARRHSGFSRQENRATFRRDRRRRRPARTVFSRGALRGSRYSRAHAPHPPFRRRKIGNCVPPPPLPKTVDTAIRSSSVFAPVDGDVARNNYFSRADRPTAAVPCSRSRKQFFFLRNVFLYVGRFRRISIQPPASAHSSLPSDLPEPYVVRSTVHRRYRNDIVTRCRYWEMQRSCVLSRPKFIKNNTDAWRISNFVRTERAVN